jgi:hypothetical protein
VAAKRATALDEKRQLYGESQSHRSLIPPGRDRDRKKIRAEKSSRDRFADF